MKAGNIIDFSDILVDEKSNQNILIYDISHKTFLGAKPLCIRSDEIDRFIEIYNGIRYLVFWVIVSLMKFVIMLNVISIL